VGFASTLKYLEFEVNSPDLSLAFSLLSLFYVDLGAAGPVPILLALSWVSTNFPLKIKLINEVFLPSMEPSAAAFFLSINSCLILSFFFLILMATMV
jgi:hypothetical protein